MIRRALRNTLNTSIPETAPVNKVLADNLEVRSFLRKKLGQIATDPTAANQEYQSQLQLGQNQLARDNANQWAAEQLADRKAKVQTNWKRVGTTAKVLGVGGGLIAGGKVIKDLLP
jgi:hypothetical protein